MARDEKTAGTAPRAGGSRRIGGARTARTAGTAANGPGKGAGKPTREPAKPPRSVRWAARRQRLSQVRTAFSMTREADPRLVPLMAIAFLVPFVLIVLIGIALSHPVLVGILGLLIGLTVMMLVFGKRVQKNAFSQVEGQRGAAAAVLQNMRGDWRVTPAVGFTREQDLVHRVLGKPGIVLVGEGAATRVRGLLVNEKRRLARFVGDVPVYDVMVGDGNGEVPLRGLEKHFVKLPHNVKPKDVNILDRKLKAMAPALPIPKGPMPGGGRMPRGKVR